MATPELDYRPQRLDLLAYRGDDLTVSLAFQNTNGSARDISTWELAAQVRVQDDDADPVAELTFSLTTDGTDGLATLALAAADAADLDGIYVWDCQRTLSDLTRTILFGAFRVARDVTR